MNITINDQVALVTAGAAGIGKTIAERFLAQGCSVHICDIDPQSLDSFLAEHPAASGSLADVSDTAAVDQVCDDLLQTHGRLDILVNNAGIPGPVARTPRAPPDSLPRLNLT